MGKVVRIGGASGFWGDSSVGAPQLVDKGEVDYLVFDYLAELTMSILAAARARNPALGYATDFVDVTMKAILRDVAARGIRVVSNAGGVNPQACADAIAALAAQQGLSLKIAVVLGDDVMPLVPALRDEAVTELQSGAALPATLLTANAYLGALPVKAALDAGAQVVVTGRCVDSAVTLGALMHEFGWDAQDWDRLAHGSLAGHIIECGCQATGGLHTDWEAVPDWAHIGYPVIGKARTPMPKHLLPRGIACIAIGLAVLLAPGFIAAPQLRATVAGASVVGWFGIVLGVVLVGVALRQRALGKRR